MSAVEFLDRAREWERVLVAKEADRSGRPEHEARATVAHRAGALPGTLENLRRGRLKEVAAHIYAGLRAGVEAELEAELRHAQHQLLIVRAAGLDPHSGAYFSLVANEARLKEALGIADTPSDGGAP